MEINIIKEDASSLPYRWNIITVCGVSAFTGDLQAILQRGIGFLRDLFTWKEGAQASRILYIMLALLREFYRDKSIEHHSSILMSFSRKINIISTEYRRQIKCQMYVYSGHALSYTKLQSWTE